VTTNGTTLDTNTAANADTLVIGNLSSGGTVVIAAAAAGVNTKQTVEVKDAATGTGDVLNVSLTTTGNLNAGVLTAANVETVNLTSVDTETGASPTANTYTLTLAADKATALNLTGSNNLKLTLTNSTKFTSIDGSGLTGVLNVTSTNTSAAATLKGGSANDVLTAATGTTADVLIGGAGDDTLTANAGLSVLTGGVGNDLFVVSTASLNPNSYATVSDFTAGDLIQITGAVSFNSVKVSLGDTAVFQDFANAAVNAVGGDDAAWFQFSGNTYIVMDQSTTNSTTFINGQDFIVKLTGLVDLSNASFNGTYFTIAL
jgi:S-layer protein